MLWLQAKDWQPKPIRWPPRSNYQGAYYSAGTDIPPGQPPGMNPNWQRLRAQAWLLQVANAGQAFMAQPQMADGVSQAVAKAVAAKQGFNEDETSSSPPTSPRPCRPSPRSFMTRPNFQTRVVLHNHPAAALWLSRRHGALCPEHQRDAGGARVRGPRRLRALGHASAGEARPRQEPVIGLRSRSALADLAR